MDHVNSNSRQNKQINLPKDVLNTIASRLPTKDVASLAATSRSMNRQFQPRLDRMKLEAQTQALQKKVASQLGYAAALVAANSRGHSLRTVGLGKHERGNLPLRPGAIKKVAASGPVPMRSWKEQKPPPNTLTADLKKLKKL